MARLERSLSLIEVTLMSVGIILGAGIYVLIGAASGLSGNGLWLSFIIAAVIASFTGLSYAELSSRFPEAGAEYVYIEKSFGKKLAWLIGWLIIAGTIIGAATVALGFSHYFSAIFNTPISLVAVSLLLVCGVILIAGVKETAFFTILFTLIETAGLVIIIFIGIPYFGNVDYLELAHGMEGVIKAGVLIFFGYIGFESITRLADETRNPDKNIPKAIILSIVLTTIIYILVGISAVSVVSWEKLSTSSAPLSIVAEEVFGGYSFLILSGIALFSTFNTVLVMLLSGSRIIYGIADEKVLPSFFTRVWNKTNTPWVAIAVSVFVAILFLGLGELEIVANLTNFTIFVTFFVVNCAVIYLRFKKPDRRKNKGFTVPFSIKKVPVIPVLGAVSSVFMISNLSLQVLFLGITLILIGFVMYYLVVKKLK
ncbi:MAG: amino acid permease [Candidatus Thermoplasmatota archaeon]